MSDRLISPAIHMVALRLCVLKSLILEHNSSMLAWSLLGVWQSY